MASKFGWILVAALAAQCPAASLAQRVGAGAAAPVPPWVIVMKPGETPAEAVREAMRAHDFARYPAAEAAVLLHPTTELPASGSGSPGILSGQILSPTLNVAVAPGLAPTIEIRFHASAGFSYVVATFTSPHGRTLTMPYYQPYTRPKNGSLTFQAQQVPGAGLYAEPGSWNLTSVEIVDAKYQKTTYSAKHLERIFSATTIDVINNGTPDFTPPTVSAGDILTRRVNLNDPTSEFKATLTAADDISGVAAPIIVVTMPTTVGTDYEAAQVLPLPELSGTFDIDIPGTVFGAFPGVWRVVGYGATDVAGNLFMEDRPAMVKATFGKIDFLVGKF